MIYGSDSGWVFKLLSGGQIRKINIQFCPDSKTPSTYIGKEVSAIKRRQQFCKTNPIIAQLLDKDFKNVNGTDYQ